MHHFESGCFYTALEQMTTQTIALPFLNLHDWFLPGDDNYWTLKHRQRYPL
jgi:hypothetical protein